MDLLEYQAKELFREMGIPVLPSQRIDHPSDLKGLKIPYPIVLKSQVRTGGRGKAGGVKFVANTIDAVAAAQTIFHLPIMGEYPQVVLAESKYDADQEFYLAVVLDRNVRRPVLLGSVKGGMNAEAMLEHIQQVVVDQEFSPFYARRLTVKMGLTGALIQAVSGIVEKMYRLFVLKDLDLVEINPLGVSASGEVMALDGKVSANDEALGRHLDLTSLVYKMNQQTNGNPVLQLPPYQHFIQLDGNIAIICNGAGLAMATLDLICFAGGQPANFLNLGTQVCYDSTATALCHDLQQGLALVTQDSQVKVVLINILSSMTTCETIVTAIETFLRQQRLSRPHAVPRFVVRLLGSDLEELKSRFDQLDIPVLENLEEAVIKAVDYAAGKN
jgi:succinyl-CoA synthetase beta subunit